MTQASFFYQARADPTWYLSQAAAPALAWWRPGAAFERRHVTHQNAQADPTWYLSQIAAPDVSWLLSGAYARLPQVTYQGQHADVAWFVIPTAVPDLAWMRQPPPLIRASVAYPSHWRDVWSMAMMLPANLILDDLLIAFTAHLFPLGATPAWLAAAAHAATVAQLSGGYQPVLRIYLPAHDRTFSTHPTLFGDEPLLARLAEGGVGAVTRELDESSDSMRLGGSSMVWLNETGFLATFGDVPFLNTEVVMTLGFVEIAEADFLPIFPGIIDRYDFTYERLTFALVDPSIKNSINLNIPISTERFPNAPDASRGLNVPIFLGVHTFAPVIQVAGTEATGVLAFAMDDESTTVLLIEDGVGLPTSSTVTVGSESIFYLRRTHITVSGKRYVELSGLTRTVPAAHGVGAIVTLTDLQPSYLIGFGADTVNRVRVNDVALASTAVRVFSIDINGHPVPVVQFLDMLDPEDIVTVDVNASAPLLAFSVPLPPAGMPPDPNLFPDGGFESGNIAGWTIVAGGTLANVRQAPNAPAGFTGTCCLELRRGISVPSVVIGSLYRDIEVIVGERYAYSVRYNNREVFAGLFAGIQTSQGVLQVGTTAIPGAYQTQQLNGLNAWTTATGTVTATEATLRLTLISYYTSLLAPLSTFFDDIQLLHIPAPVLTDHLVNGDWEAGTTTGWSISGTVESFFASDGAALDVTPFDGQYLGVLQGGIGLDGNAYEDMATIVGTSYDYSISCYNRSNEFNILLFSPTPGLRRYWSQGSVSVGTPDIPTLYAARTVGAANAWATTTGSFVATTTVTRLTLSSYYATTTLSPTPLPSFFDSIILLPSVANDPGLGAATLYRNAGENPVDAILYMLGLFYPTATYDVQAFATAREILAPMRFRGLFTNPGDSGTLLQRMAQQCKSLLYQTPLGDYTITVLDSSRPVVAAFDATNIIVVGDPPVSTFGRASMPADSLYTSFFVYYDTLVGGSTSPGDYAGAVFATPTETTAPLPGPIIAACASAYALYGRDNRLEVYADFVRDIDSAHLLLAWIVARHAIRQDPVSFRTWLDAVPLQLGQVGTVTHAVHGTDEAIEAEFIRWSYQPGTMEVDLSMRPVAASIDVGLGAEGAEEQIPETPIANDDDRMTPYNTPVSFDITANDVPAVAPLAPETVTLDPGNFARQTTYTDTDHADFEIDDLGEVTCTPVTDYVGNAVAYYMIYDTDGLPSNVAIITVMIGPPGEPAAGEWVYSFTIEHPEDVPGDIGLHVVNATTLFGDVLLGGTGDLTTDNVEEGAACRVIGLTGGGVSTIVGSFLPYDPEYPKTLLAISAIAAHGGSCYVAYQMAPADNSGGYASPTILALSTLDNLGSNDMADDWTLSLECPATYKRVGAFISFDGILYASFEPMVPGTDSLDVWMYDGTWSLMHAFGTGYNTLRCFANFEGTLYAGVDGNLVRISGGVSTIHFFSGPITAMVAWNGLLIIAVRNGGQSEIYSTPDGNAYMQQAAIIGGPVNAMAPGANGRLYAGLGSTGTQAVVYSTGGSGWALHKNFTVSEDADMVTVSALAQGDTGRLFAAIGRTIAPGPDVDVWYLD